MPTKAELAEEIERLTKDNEELLETVVIMTGKLEEAAQLIDELSPGGKLRSLARAMNTAVEKMKAENSKSE